MENFDINNFDPTTAKIISFVEEYRGLTIAKDGLDTVKKAKKDLQSERIFITKTLKADRDKAIKYQKDNIVKEKELVGIIAEVEKPLDDEILTMEMKEEMDKRKESMDIRREELKAIGLDKEYTEEFLLTMNRVQFMDFLNTEKSRLFDIEQNKKRELEAEAKRLSDLKEAEEKGRLQAEEKAKEDAERLVQENLNREAKEKDMKEQAELQARLDKEAEEHKAKEEQERLEKATEYKKWLKDNGYTEENKSEYKIEKQEGKVVLWKYVSEFII